MSYSSDTGYSDGQHPLRTYVVNSHLLAEVGAFWAFYMHRGINTWPVGGGHQGIPLDTICEDDNCLQPLYVRMICRSILGIKFL